MSLTLIRIQTKNQIIAGLPANSSYLEQRCQVELYYSQAKVTDPPR